jgi:branched-chain amino acid transport system ATP-binding protein
MSVLPQRIYDTVVLSVADRLYVLETGKVVHEASADAVRKDQGPLMRFLGVH